MKLYNLTRQVEEIAREIAKRLNFEFDIEKVNICFEKDSKGDYTSVWYLEEFVHAYVDIQIVGEEIKYNICDTTIFFPQ